MLIAPDLKLRLGKYKVRSCKPPLYSADFYSRQIFLGVPWLDQMSVLRTLLHDEPHRNDPDFTAKHQTIIRAFVNKYLDVMHEGFHAMAGSQGGREYIELALEPNSTHYVYERAIGLYFPEKTKISKNGRRSEKFKSISPDASYVLSTDLKLPFREWKFDGGEWHGWKDFLDPSVPRKLFVRGMVSDIREELKDIEEVDLMRKLAIARAFTGEDEITMLERKPKLKDASICVSPSWPEGIVRDFKISGRTSLIRIE